MEGSLALEGYSDVTIVNSSAISLVATATRDSDGLQVVLKRGRRRAAQREYELLQQLDGSGVTPSPLDIITQGATSCVVMTMARGKPGSRLQAVSVQDWLTVGIALANAIHVVHGHRIIHSDIKPGNFVFDSDSGQLTLIDLNMSQRFGASSHGRGTTEFMAPEQTGRVKRLPNYQSDLFSLGATLYWLATSVLPHGSSADLAACVHRILAVQPAAITTLRPEFPAKLSEVVDKLLQKRPEDRYQSAFGVVQDLKACLAALSSGASLDDVELQTQLPPPVLRTKIGLVGRDDVLETLRESYAATSRGHCTCVRLSGVSGVGKTAIVQALVHTLPGSCLLGSGKCGQSINASPGQVISEALQMITQRLLSLPSAALRGVQTRIEHALQGQGGALVQAFPAVAPLVTRCETAADLNPAEAMSRLNRSFLALIGAISTSDSPLLIFLDDLQWADAITFRILKALVSSSHVNHVMVIASFRSNEVGEDHPLLPALEPAKQAGGPWSNVDMEIEELGPQHTKQLVAAHMWRSPGKHDPRLDVIAGITHRKTLGNPFFAMQFLRRMWNAGAVWYSIPLGSWVVDPTKARDLPHSDNAVDVVVDNISRLSSSTVRALTAAVCVGRQFLVSDVAAVLGLGVQDVVNDLRLAASMAFVMEVNEQSGALPSRSSGESEDDVSEGTMFQFYHDRVEQAVATLVSEEEMAKMKLFLGRLYTERYEQGSGGRSSVLLFKAMSYFAGAEHLVTDEVERHHVACLQLRAATSAVQSTSYHTAEVCASTGIALIGGEDRWQWAGAGKEGDLAAGELVFELVKTLAMSLFLSSKNEEAGALMSSLEEHCQTPLQKCRLYLLHGSLMFALTRFDASWEYHCKALAALGRELNPTPTMESMMALTHRAVVTLAQRGGVPGLAALPIATDVVCSTANAALANLITTAYFLGDEYFGTLTATAVLFAVEHGPTTSSAGPILFFALGYQTMGMCDEAYEMGKFAYDMAANSDDGMAQLRTQYCFGSHIAWLRHPIAQNRSIVEASHKGACAASEHFFAYGCELQLTLIDFLGGHSLRQFAQDSLPYVTSCREEHNFPAGSYMFVGSIFMARTLTGDDSLGESVAQEFGSAEAYEAFLDANMPPTISNWFYSLRCLQDFVLGDYASACGAGAKAAATEAGLRGHLNIPLSRTFYAAALLMRARDCEDDEGKAKLMAQAEEQHEAILGWVKKSPQNLGYCGVVYDAMHAIAKDSGMDATLPILDECLAAITLPNFQRAVLLEHIGAYYISHSCRYVGMKLLRESYELYVKWCATAKCRLLVATYGEAITAAASRRRSSVPSAAQLRSATAGITSTSDSTSTPVSARQSTWKLVDQAVDMDSIFSATSTLARQHSVEDVLHSLMKVLMKHTASEKAVVIMAEDSVAYRARQARVSGAGVGAGAGAASADELAAAAAPPQSPRGDHELATRAVCEMIGSEMVVKIPTEGECWRTDDSIARDVVRYVIASRQPVLLDNAAQDLSFRHDPYVQRVGLRSVLCAPIFNQDKFLGVVYLHNNSLHGAYLARRLQLVDVFTTQMAVALRTASIVEYLKHSSEVLRKTNVELERLSHVKDRFLATTSHELRTPLNGILGLASLLAETEMTAEQHDSVSTIVDSAELLRNLLNDLIDLSKLQSGQMNISKAPFKLGTVLARAASIAVPMFTKKNLNLVISNTTYAFEQAQGELCEWLVNGDKNRIQQVVLNLLTNAIKFTPRGSITLRLGVERSTSEGSAPYMFVFSVQDTGIGIKPEHQEQIFNMFYQVDSRDARDFGGSGIGLALSNLLITQMGGSMGVESDGCSGSTFTVKLPLPVLSRLPLPSRGCLASLKVAVRLPPDSLDMDTATGVLQHAAAELVPSAADACVLLTSRTMLTKEMYAAAQEAGTAVLLLTSGFAWAQLSEEYPMVHQLPMPLTAVLLAAAVKRAAGQPTHELDAAVAAWQADEDVRADSTVYETSATRDVAAMQRPVLVVDDNPVNLRVLKRILTKRGYEVETAENGVQAVELARERKFSLVLMDVMMPKMNGLEATRAIREWDQITPVVAVTASVEADDVQRCRDAGMNEFMGKPVKNKTVMDMVTRFAVPRKEVTRKRSRMAMKKAKSPGQSSGKAVSP